MSEPWVSVKDVARHMGVAKDTAHASMRGGGATEDESQPTGPQDRSQRPRGTKR